MNSVLLLSGKEKEDQEPRKKQLGVLLEPQELHCARLALVVEAF